MKARKSEKGFTIIELVVVILLLGILTATALPRFMDVTTQAHDAVVEGVVGGMATGVALARATWFAEGRSTLVSGFGDGTLGMNTTGYPTGNAGGAPADASDCVGVYAGILQPGGRPTTALFNTTGAIGGAFLTDTDAANLSYATDFEVAHSANTCWFIYVAEGSAVSSPVIVYDSSNGFLSLSSGAL